MRASWCLLMISTACWASHFQDWQAVKRQIQTTQQHISKMAARKLTLREQLKDSASLLRTLDTQRQQLLAQIHDHREHLDTLKNQSRVLSDRLETLHTQSQKVMLALYGLAHPRQQPLPTPGSSAIEPQWQAHQLKHVAKVMQHLLHQQHVLEEHLKHNLSQQQHTSHHLAQAHAFLKTQASQAQHLLKQRSQALQALNQHLLTQQHKLHSLEMDQRRLRNMFDLLDQRSLRDTFSPLKKGHLPWPVTFKRILVAFHQPLMGGKLTSDAVVLETQGAQPVQAIAPGQVVFAGSLLGYGQLVVVNHGHHFFSLYGHNQQLLVHNKDWIQADQRLAISDSTKNRVYFGLRNSKNALNPRAWCRRHT